MYDISFKMTNADNQDVTDSLLFRGAVVDFFEITKKTRDICMAA